MKLTKKMIQLNARAKHTLFFALNVGECNCISCCDNAKGNVNYLPLMNELIRLSKISMLVHKHELFKMNPEDSISDMFTLCADIVNGLNPLGKTYC